MFSLRLIYWDLVYLCDLKGILFVGAGKAGL
jgi:hypothetical protein